MPPGRWGHGLRLSAHPLHGAVLAVIVLGCGALVPGPARAQFAGFERITSYDVTIRVDRSGAMAVTEVIDYDFGSQQRHGILRDIPVRLHYDDRYDRVYPLSNVEVEGSPGTPDQVKLETAGNYKRIRIGDPDRTISGAHRYTISYRITNALNAFADHDELFWNAVGHEWTAPIERATVTVTLPGRAGDIACFAGPNGSRLNCEATRQTGDTAQFGHRDLGPSEGVTVVVALAKGMVPEPTPVLDERWSFARAFSVTPATVGGSGGLLALIAAVVTRVLWRRGRDRRFVGSPVDVAFGTVGDAEQTVPLMDRPLIPVEYEPPDKLRPGQVGTLVDERANPLDVTATIVDLAVRGYLRIDAIEKQGWFGKPDWVLVKLKEAGGLLAYETKLLDGLFVAGDEVRLSALKNTFATRLKRVQDALYDDAVARGWFSSRPDSTRNAWAALGVVALIAAVGITVLAAAFTHLALLGIPFVVGALLLLAGAKNMPRRTAAGTGVLRRTLGFRRFIEESEKERARFAERTNLFSEYLPYAIVFGATEQWAKAFAGLDGQLPDTGGWYHSSTPFTAMAFASSMDGFAVTTAGTITSTPSGSGSSGFSGGGFSGGGGGGGGGGSW